MDGDITGNCEQNPAYRLALFFDSEVR